MARPDIYSNQASPISTTKKQNPRSSGTPRSTLNASNIKQHWRRSRNDTPLLVRSSVKFNDSNISVPFSSASETSAPPEGGPCSNVVILDKIPRKQPSISGSKVHTKPLSKKMSRDEPPSIKHLQSSAKQEGLEVQSDSLANFNVRRPVLGLRHRSTSDISQKSTISSSSMSKPASQYVHPMRQARAAYPPTGQSYQTSLAESDDSESSFGRNSENQSSPDTFQPSVRAQAPRLSLQIHDGSFTPLPGISQTNIAGRSSFGYARDNGSALDTPSPISRSSLDFVFRSKTRASVDPVSRAATVQAARQAFEEKEEAKTRKFEQQQMKAEEKQTRRKEKQHWRTSMRDNDNDDDDDDDEIPSSTTEEISEKPNATGTSHATTPASHPQSTSTSWKSRSKSTWMLFITWLRTRVFKLRRRIRN